MFVHWFCTPHVIGLSLCVLVLVPLFHVLNLVLKLIFMLFASIIFVHVTPCEILVGCLVKDLDCGKGNDNSTFTFKVVIGVVLVYWYIGILAIYC
jgi:hypothetical protein